MLTAIYCNGNHSEKYHTKEKGNEDLFQYVPVQFFHLPAKEMIIDERFCEENPIVIELSAISSGFSSVHSNPLKNR